MKLPHRSTDRKAALEQRGKTRRRYGALPVWLLVICLFTVLAGCQTDEQKAAKNYDLGVRYLEEGNYEEAVIAFTHVIEIDPKRADAYTGRGQALLHLEETEGALAKAQADFEEAVNLDSSLTDAWLGLAEAHTRQGNPDKAMEALQKGLEATNDSRIQEKLNEVFDEVYPEPAYMEFSVQEGEVSIGTVTAYDEQNTALWAYSTAEVESVQASSGIIDLGRRGDAYYDSGGFSIILNFLGL